MKPTLGGLPLWSNVSAVQARYLILIHLLNVQYIIFSMCVDLAYESHLFVVLMTYLVGTVKAGTNTHRTTYKTKYYRAAWAFQHYIPRWFSDWHLVQSPHSWEIFHWNCILLGNFWHVCISNVSLWNGESVGPAAVYQTFSTNHLSYIKILVPIYIFRAIKIFAKKWPFCHKI